MFLLLLFSIAALRRHVSHHFAIVRSPFARPPTPGASIAVEGSDKCAHRDEAEFQKRSVADLRRIEHDLDRLSMRPMIAIGRVGHIATHITDPRQNDAPSGPGSDRACPRSSHLREPHALRLLLIQITAIPLRLTYRSRPNSPPQ